jgi:hypothetical protein
MVIAVEPIPTRVCSTIIEYSEILQDKERLRRRSQTAIEIRIKLMIIYHCASVARRSFRAKVLLS